MGCYYSKKIDDLHEPLLRVHTTIELVSGRFFCCHPSADIDIIDYDIVLSDAWKGCNQRINAYWNCLPSGRVLLVLDTVYSELYAIKMGVQLTDSDINDIIATLQPLLRFVNG